MARKIKYVDIDYPELVRLFEDPNQSHVGASSNKRINFVCDCCSNIYTETVRNVVRRGNAFCISCRDGVSYPEKFMCNLLDQLEIVYKLHYYSEWTNGYFYDFVFIYNNQKYIIEMDGGLGHGNGGFNIDDIQKSIEVDKEKDNLALENNYNLIRIDCNYQNDYDNRYLYIKENIINELSDILPLEFVDFDRCNKYALSSLFYKIIDYYKNESKFIDNIKEKFHLSKSCITKYLRHAMKIGILPSEHLHDNDKFKDINVPIIKYYNDNIHTSKIIYCYDDAIAFDSIKALANYLGLDYSSISNQLNNYGGSILGKHYCYYNNLPNDFDFKPIVYPKLRNKTIYQYTKNKDKLINIYKNKTYLPKEFDYAHVSAVCNGKRNSHKGFWWSYLNIFKE